MAYFADLSPYRYTFPRARTLNVGWLARGRPFPKGEVPDLFLERLGACCVAGPMADDGCVICCAGFHVCEFCEPAGEAANDDERKANLKRIAALKKDTKRGVPGAKVALREAQQRANELVRAAVPGPGNPQPCHGTGEIWVPAGEWMFAAPSMLGHYIAVHCYRPPQVFIDTVMGRPLSEPVRVRRWWQFWK